VGEFDLATAPEIEQTLLGVAEQRTGAVIVDLTGCEFLDASGLRVLVAARDRLERSNPPLTLVLSNPSLLKIFQITHLDGLFEIYPLLREAAHPNGDR
jgi:anti-sigma B factor antagonist